MKIMFDTSALFKRYLAESGQEQVAQILDRATTVALAPHCRIELMATVARTVREGRISLADGERIAFEMGEDLKEWEVLPLSAQVEQASLRALNAAALRGMDALHVGAALVARAGLFVTADIRQAQAAQALGLPTELVSVF
jgi:uncharacterized protein